MVEKKKLVEEMFTKGILVSEDFLENESNNSIVDKIEMDNDLIVLNSDYVKVIEQQSSLVDWYELDRLKAEAESEKNDELYQNELQQLKKTSLVLNTPTFTQEQELSNSETEMDNNNSKNIDLTPTNSLNEKEETAHLLDSNSK